MAARSHGTASTDICVSRWDHPGENSDYLRLTKRSRILRETTMCGGMLVGVAQCGWAYRDYDIAGPGRSNARRRYASPRVGPFDGTARAWQPFRQARKGNRVGGQDDRHDRG